jgi:hypothetical protein
MIEGIIYLATPYGHKDKAIETWRLEVFEKVDAHLAAKGHSIISPMHMIDYALSRGLPVTWDYWQEHGETLLCQSDSLVIICVPEWRDSKGVAGEIALAKKHNKIITYLYEPWLRAHIDGYTSPYTQEGFRDMY